MTCTPTWSNCQAKAMKCPTCSAKARDGRTLAREAYFLGFARDIQNVAKMPVIDRRHPSPTGGRAGDQQRRRHGRHRHGPASDPNLPRDWRHGKDSAPQLPPITWKNKALASLANMAVVKFQLRKLSLNKTPNPRVSPLRALIMQQLANASRTRQYRRWMAQRAD